MVCIPVGVEAEADLMTFPEAHQAEEEGVVAIPGAGEVEGRTCWSS